MIPRISKERRRDIVKRIIVNHVQAPKKANKGLFHRVNTKAHGRESTESTKLAHEFLEEYLHCTSLHGVKYLGKLQFKTSTFEKLFWISIMICSFVFLIWMVNTFWVRYNTNPVRTVVESFQSPIFLVPFPAVTLCPLVTPLLTRRQELLRQLRLPHGMSNKTAMFLLKYASAFSDERTPGGKEYLNNLKTLLKLNHMTLIDLIKILRPCKDVIESCWWNGVRENCSKLMKESYTSVGRCCSFNYFLEEYIKNDSIVDTSKMRRIPFFGSSSGLTIVVRRDLLTEENGNVKFSTNSVGVLVFAHHPLEYVTPISSRHILQAKQEMRVAINPFIKKKLAGYYRRNHAGELVPHCANKNATLKYIPIYRYSNCFISCSIENALKICGCLPYYYQPVAIKHSLRICDWEDFQCLYANSDVIRVVGDKKNNFTCTCQTSCEFTYYESQTSSGTLNFRQDINVTPMHKNLTSSQAILKVYINSETLTILDTIPIADELYLLAAVGGIFSLFVGCSFISTVEIFYFIGLFLYACCNPKKSK